jgi:hypothetical protein
MLPPRSQLSHAERGPGGIPAELASIAFNRSTEEPRIRFDGSLPWFGLKARQFYSGCQSGRGFRWKAPIDGQAEGWAQPFV